jgi:RimJ/RimL family protein N-acetyltransferase
VATDPQGVASDVLRTARLDLVPMHAGIVEAVLLGRRHDAERFTGATMPARWPNPELVERAFSLTLEAIREDPTGRLWGARVVIAGREEPRRVVGSIVYKSAPAGDGICEIAYGVEEGSQGQGFATEAVSASVAWALRQPGARAVHASTFAWHKASVRVLEKVGMKPVGTSEHETMGEMVIYGINAG